MSYYTPRDGNWTEHADPPADTPYIEVDETAPTVRFVGKPESVVDLSGAPARSDTETVHTVMILAPDLSDGITLCALRAEDNDFTVEDRRPPRGPHPVRQCV